MEILVLGDTRMKKIKKYICYLLIVSSVLLLSGCSNNKEEELLKSKLTSEMQYFDKTISKMLNNANGIKFENYQISREKIEEKQESETTSNKGGEDTSSSDKSSSSSAGGSSDGSSNSSSEDESKRNDYQYKMVQNSILVKERTPDWDSLTSQVESLYSDWAIVTLDLYKQNIDNQKILAFNTDLDAVTKAIKDKDKAQTLVLLAKLYSYIPTYYLGFSNDQMETNLYKVKSGVLNAYSLIEQNNIDEVKKQLLSAEEAMIAMINNMGGKNQKEYNLNKAYILLKDLQNSIDKNDVDIFYLKYKNLMQELNVL